MYMLILYIDNYQYEVNEMRLADVSLICKALGDSKQAGNSADVVKWRKNADAGFWKDLVLLSLHYLII